MTVARFRCEGCRSSSRWSLPVEIVSRVVPSIWWR